MRWIPSISLRVSDMEVGRVLHNHDQRIKQLVSRASGRRTKPKPLTISPTACSSSSNNHLIHTAARYITVPSGYVFCPIDLPADVHKITDWTCYVYQPSAGAGTITAQLVDLDMSTGATLVLGEASTTATVKVVKLRLPNVNIETKKHFAYSIRVTNAAANDLRVYGATIGHDWID